MKFKSCAQWPAECCPAIGNYSEDTHDTQEQAEAVCGLLHKNGFGGDGIYFPVRTWVEPFAEDHPATLPENLIPALIDAYSAKAKAAGSAFAPVV